MLNKLLEPVKVDIKRTNTKSETARKYSNDKIIVLHKSIVFYKRIYNYIRDKKVRVGRFEHFFRISRVTGNTGTFLA